MNDSMTRFNLEIILNCSFRHSRIVADLNNSLHNYVLSFPEPLSSEGRVFLWSYSSTDNRGQWHAEAWKSGDFNMIYTFENFSWSRQYNSSLSADNTPLF